MILSSSGHCVFSLRKMAERWPAADREENMAALCVGMLESAARLDLKYTRVHWCLHGEEKLMSVTRR